MEDFALWNRKLKWFWYFNFYKIKTFYRCAYGIRQSIRCFLSKRRSKVQIFSTTSLKLLLLLQLPRFVHTSVELLPLLTFNWINLLLPSMRRLMFSFNTTYFQCILLVLILKSFVFEVHCENTIKVYMNLHQ